MATGYPYNPSPATLHVGRIIELPALAAQCAIDTCRAAAPEARRDNMTSSWVVAIGRSRGVFEGTGQVLRRADHDPFRRWFGVLGPVRGRRYRVEAELGPWSSTSCELGIRPVGRPRLSGVQGWDAYFELANDVLTVLVESLERAQPARHGSSEGFPMAGR